MPARILLRLPRVPSNGASNLRQAIGSLLCRASRFTVVPRQYRMVINWGNTSELDMTPRASRHWRYLVLNSPDAVARAVNKTTAFSFMREAGVRVPTTTDSLPEDREGIWLARKTLTGSSGEGIVVIREGDEVVPEAPLYSKYIPKQKEYRVHVVDENVIFIQEKRRSLDTEQDKDQKLIRSHHNGWVYCIEDVELDDDCKQQAINAVKALGLNFGAVDLVVGKHDGLGYVLEINTAPGLASPTLTQAYKDAFLRLYEENF